MTAEQISYYLNILALAVILGCWMVFAGTLLYRRVGSSAKHRSREPLSWLGLILQLVSYPISWAVWRSPVFSPFADRQYVLNIALQLIAAAVGIWSAWLAVSAIRELGKQWSLQARVLDDHNLVTTGVYSMIRHPIYTAMLGMLVATGLVVSHWLALCTAIVIFLAGTKIRIHLEEKLLAEAFGEKFAAWRSAVPGLIPFTRGVKNSSRRIF
ncbi:protein-S-isoprenylcysteine O-methyltransferase [soil metagenome]